MAQSRFWCGRFSIGIKQFLCRQAYCRRKASFGATGLGTAQSQFWCDRFNIGAKPVL